MDALKNILDRSADLSGRFTFNQKVLLGAILATAILSVIIFSFWLRSDESAVLFTNLSPEDAAFALEELNKQNIDAELGNGGSTITVPRAEVHRLRVELAAKGIPSSGTVGWGIFDGKQYGVTEFVQNVNFKRALEGELTRTIESIQGIRSARVHLVLPKPSIFKRNDSPATASVVVSLGRGAALGESQIAGIQSLVSGSVESLDTSNVTVIDQQGVVLSRAVGEDALAGSETQLAMKKEVDAYLSGKAASMLDKVLGAGRSIVRVDATLNFERLQQEREIFDPDGTVVRSEEREESTQPGGAGNESSVANYEINRTVETVIGSVGGVRGMSVAVFVDGRYGEAGEDGTPAYAPLAAEELEQIQRIVTTAVGLDAERGDRIEVVNMQFQAPGEEVPEEPGLLAAPWLNQAPQLVGRLLLFIVVAVMLLQLKKSLGGLVAGAATTGRRSGARRAEASPDGPSIHDSNPDHRTAQAIIDEVRDFAGEKPEEVADLVHAWIEESGGAR